MRGWAAGAKTIFSAISGAVVLGALSQAVAQPRSPAEEPVTLSAREQAETALARQPESWFVEHMKGPRRQIDGDLLDARIQYLLEQSPSSPDRTVEPELKRYADPAQRSRVRASVDRSWLIRSAESAPMASVEDRRIKGRAGGEIPLRIYTPKAATPGPLPVLTYYHGGGFVFASTAAMDRALRLLANEAGVIVVSADYRLSPENPYPAAHDDAQDAFVWVQAHAAELGGDPAQVAVGGDSAGGNLAVATALRQAKAKGPRPLFALLYYPAVSIRQDERSYAQFDHGYNLERPFMDAVTRMTFPHPAPEVSPLELSSLKAMPATILITPGFDPLRDQGRRFARRLEAEGVAVTYLNYGGLTHGFLNLSGIVPEAEHAARQTGQLFGQAIRSRHAELALQPLVRARQR